MNKKIVKTFVYEGLGFPIELHNVELILFNGKRHPKIDVRKIADDAIKSLVLQKSRLTGNQIKFIRHYFSLSLREFGKVVNESHAAVKKWEAFGNDATNMDRNIEMMMRLTIYDRIAVKTKKDRIHFYDKYQSLKNVFESARL